jgi:membrane protease subunit HflK
MGTGDMIPDIKLPNLNANTIVLIIVGLVVVVGLATSIYTVAPDEVGVVQRFGAYLTTVDQGLHFKLPFFIDKVTNVKTTFVYKQEFGFRTTSAGVESQFRTQGGAIDAEKLVLSGDLNVVAIEWVMQYTISDPKAYLFNVRDVEGTLRDISESAVKQVVGDFAVDEVITTQRELIGNRAKDLVNEILLDYGTGVNVTDVRLRNVNPPTAEVQDAFEAVNRAEQKREELIRNAEAEYNATVPRERGRAQQSIDQALGQKQARINIAEGEAEQFTSILNEYRNSREVTRTRLYLETLTDVLRKMGKVLIVDDTLEGLMPLLGLQGSLLKGGAQ